jgi:multisubunit Na+/H+ antiporter MnhB subunit
MTDPTRQSRCRNMRNFQEPHLGNDQTSILIWILLSKFFFHIEIGHRIAKQTRSLELNSLTFRHQKQKRKATVEVVALLIFLAFNFWKRFLTYFTTTLHCTSPASTDEGSASSLPPSLFVLFLLSLLFLLFLGEDYIYAHINLSMSYYYTHSSNLSNVTLIIFKQFQEILKSNK